MNRIYDPISTSGDDAQTTPWAPLALLVLTYASTLGAPYLLHELRNTTPDQVDWSNPSALVPTAAAASCALGLAIAILMALTRMIRDLQSRPYLTLGPALGALLGMALLALRAPFTFRDVDSSTLAVLCVSVSILGGAMVQGGSGGAALLGMPLAALPTIAVAAWLWSTRPPDGDLSDALAQCEVANRAFLVLLGVVGVLMTAMALLARALGGARASSWHDVRDSWPAARQALRHSLQGFRRMGDSWAGSMAAFRTSMAAPGRGGRFGDARTGAMRKLKTLWNTKAGEAPPYGFSVWRYHDSDTRGEDVRIDESELADSLRRSARVWPIVLTFVLLAGAAVAIGFWMTHR